MKTDNAAVPGEEPERDKVDPHATGRHTAVTHARRAADFLRKAGAEVAGRDLALTFKVDDRVFSVSASERGETQR